MYSLQNTEDPRCFEKTMGCGYTQNREAERIVGTSIRDHLMRDWLIKDQLMREQFIRHRFIRDQSIKDP